MIFSSKNAAGLPEADANKLLRMVDDGPDLSKYSNIWRPQGDQRAVPNAAVTDEWRLAWLTVLKSIAGEERLKQLDELVKQYGPPRPAFSVW